MARLRRGVSWRADPDHPTVEIKGLAVAVDRAQVAYPGTEDIMFILWTSSHSSFVFPLLHIATGNAELRLSPFMASFPAKYLGSSSQVNL